MRKPRPEALISTGRAMADHELTDFEKRFGDALREKEHYIDIDYYDSEQWHWLAANILDVLRGLGVQIDGSADA